MTRRKQGATTVTSGHRFGGDWTETKLEILRRYLEGYSTALKNQAFKTAYIDAFAGTGYRTSEQEDAEGNLLFPDLAAEAPQGFLEGSARLALRVEPGFDTYIFIERHAGRYQQLKALLEEFPERADAIRIQQGEANEVIQRLCAKDWTKHRAVLFLDPMVCRWSGLRSRRSRGQEPSIFGSSSPWELE